MSTRKKIQNSLSQVQEELKVAEEKLETRRLELKDVYNRRMQMDSQYLEVKATGDAEALEIWREGRKLAGEIFEMAARESRSAMDNVSTLSERRNALLNQLPLTADSESGTSSNYSSAGVFSPQTRAVVGEDSHTQAYLKRLKQFLKKRGLTTTYSGGVCRIMDGVSEVVYQFPMDNEDVVRNIVVSFLLTNKGERNYTIKEWAVVLNNRDHHEVISDFVPKKTPLASPES